MSSIEQFRLIRSRVPQFLGDLDSVMTDLGVAPLHRTPVTALLLGEVFAKAAPLRPETQSNADFWRSAVLPAVQNLVSGVVEVMTINADQVVKAAYAAYSYRCDMAYPSRYSASRPCVNAYADKFEKELGEMIKTYPNIPGHFYVIENFLSTEGQAV
jgi:hypothetical protein